MSPGRGRHATIVLLLALVGSMSACDSSDPVPEPSSTDAATTGSTAEFTGTRAEWVELVAACLTDAGWQVRATADPTNGRAVLEAQVTREQEGAYEAAYDACVEEAPQRPVANTDEELRQLYDHEVARYECMVDDGYGPTPPPSFESWLETVRSGGVNWIAGDGVADTQLQGAIADCPPDPEAWW